MDWIPKNWREGNRGEYLDNLWVSVIRLVIFLPLVTLLAYISIKYGSGKIQRNTAVSRMQFVDRLSLGPKSGLFVVKVVEQYFLISVNEQQIQIMKELDEYPVSQPVILPKTGLDKIISQAQEFWTSKYKQRGKKS